MMEKVLHILILVREFKRSILKPVLKDPGQYSNMIVSIKTKID